jgi:PKD repeat protein
MKNEFLIRIIVIFISLIFLGLFGYITFSSADSNVITYTNKFDIVAGATICFHEKLENNRDKEINITKINHIGTPDLEGINIILYNATSTNNGYIKGEELELPLKIDVGDTYHFFICYETDVALKPDTYKMETNFYINEEEDNKSTSSTKKNKRPVADANGPYFEIKEVPIFFNASDSYDPDGEIKNYIWEFGDGTIINKMNLSHTYAEEGNYTIILTVTDDKGKSDMDTTYALISKGANIPPSEPEIYGNTALNINKNYTFSAYSFNNDNDKLKYNFSWGDGTYNLTDFVENATTVQQTHSWNKKGIYDLKVTVTDENNASSANTLTIYVDVMEFIDNDLQGYILDKDADGIYDLFHNYKTNNETTLGFQNGWYKIDVDNDGKWDYDYNSTSKKLMDIKKDTKEDTNSLCFIIIPIILIIIVIAIIVFYRRLNIT